MSALIHTPAPGTGPGPGPGPGRRRGVSTCLPCYSKKQKVLAMICSPGTHRSMLLTVLASATVNTRVTTAPGAVGRNNARTYTTTLVKPRLHPQKRPRPPPGTYLMKPMSPDHQTLAPLETLLAPKANGSLQLCHLRWRRLNRPLAIKRMTLPCCCLSCLAALSMANPTRWVCCEEWFV